MASDYQALMGRFWAGGTVMQMYDNVVDSDIAISLTAQYLYTDGPRGTSGNTQLCEQIQNAIQNSVTMQGNANVSYHTNGYVGIYLNIATNSLWDDTTVQYALGHSAAEISNARIYKADVPARYVWRPTKQAAGFPTTKTQGTSSDETFFAQTSRTIVGRTNDGTTFSLEGNTVRDGSISFVNLPDDDVIIQTSGGYDCGVDGEGTTTFQRFWLDVIAKGQPIRLYMDRDNANTTSAYDEILVGEEDQEEIGSIMDYMGRHIRNYNGLWDVELPFMQAVERTA